MVNHEKVKDSGAVVNANMPAMEFLISQLHKLCQAKDAEVVRLTAKCEAMQHVVNCASLFSGTADDEESDNDDDFEARMEMMQAVEAYRAALNSEPSLEECETEVCKHCHKTFVKGPYACQRPTCPHAHNRVGGNSGKTP